jgi:cyclic pyranopterin phosphate synthase
MYDRYSRRITYLRISVTDRCNLRCAYCMPSHAVAWLDRRDILSFEEIYEVARTAVDMGMDKIRLTGGEPLVRRGVLDLVAMIGRIEGIKDYAMTTNGVLLARYAAGLRAAGLHRLNVHLDTLDPERFRRITRGGDLQAVLDGLDEARAAGFAEIKLNCVIDETPLEKDAQAVLAFGRDHGMEVRFIRQMRLSEGRFWPVHGGAGGRCGACNRLRLSSDGKIIPCLFSDDAYDVRDLGVEQAFRMAVQGKPLHGRQSSHTLYAIGG